MDSPELESLSSVSLESVVSLSDSDSSSDDPLSSSLLEVFLLLLQRVYSFYSNFHCMHDLTLGQSTKYRRSGRHTKGLGFKGRGHLASYPGSQKRELGSQTSICLCTCSDNTPDMTQFCPRICRLLSADISITTESSRSSQEPKTLLGSMANS